MRPHRLTPIVIQGLGGLIVVLYFSCFGEVPSFFGAFKVMFHLITDTLKRQNLLNDYYGLTWLDVYFTVRLVLLATLVSLILGVILTVIRTRVRKRFLAEVFQIISALLESIPEPLYIVLIVVFILYLMFRWNVFLPVFPYDKPTWNDTWIPALTITLPGAFYIERVLHLKIREEVDRPYVSTALSKGLSRRQAFYKHVLPNGWAIVLEQMPVVVSIISSSALFTEFFMDYRGALYQFTFATGWNMVTGTYQSFEKPFHLPLYQPGLVFLIGGILVVVWMFLRIFFEWLYTFRFGGTR